MINAERLRWYSANCCANVNPANRLTRQFAKREKMVSSASTLIILWFYPYYVNYNTAKVYFRYIGSVRSCTCCDYFPAFPPFTFSQNSATSLRIFFILCADCSMTSLRDFMSLMTSVRVFRYEQSSLHSAS